MDRYNRPCRRADPRPTRSARILAGVARGAARAPTQCPPVAEEPDEEANREEKAEDAEDERRDDNGVREAWTGLDDNCNCGVGDGVVPVEGEGGHDGGEDGNSAGFFRRL
ncbi:unnamed protein product [Cutaneotrichosporon oleaginosum]